MELEKIYLEKHLLLVEPKTSYTKNSSSKFISVEVVRAGKECKYKESDILIIAPNILTEWIVDENPSNYFLVNEEFVKAKQGNNDKV